MLDCLAESLKVAFGIAGMRLVELEKKDVEFIKTPEARGHKESEAIRALTSNSKIIQDAHTAFPSET